MTVGDQQKPMTWLIVEDDPSIRDIVEVMCQIWGFNVISLSDGFKASEWLASKTLPEPLPDVGLLDIRMPGPDGHEIAAMIRKHPQLSNIGIILMTAYELKGEEERKVMEHSRADLLRYKPLPRMDKLLELVKNVVEKRKEKAAAESAEPTKEDTKNTGIPDKKDS